MKSSFFSIAIIVILSVVVAHAAPPPPTPNFPGGWTATILQKFYVTGEKQDLILLVQDNNNIRVDLER
jgi:hypothetical protein